MIRRRLTLSCSVGKERIFQFQQNEIQAKTPLSESTKKRDRNLRTKKTHMNKNNNNNNRDGDKFSENVKRGLSKQNPFFSRNPPNYQTNFQQTHQWLFHSLFLYCIVVCVYTYILVLYQTNIIIIILLYNNLINNTSRVIINNTVSQKYRYFLHSQSLSQLYEKEFNQPIF